MPAQVKLLCCYSMVTDVSLLLSLKAYAFVVAIVKSYSPFLSPLLISIMNGDYIISGDC